MNGTRLTQAGVLLAALTVCTWPGQAKAQAEGLPGRPHGLSPVAEELSRAAGEGPPGSAGPTYAELQDELRDDLDRALEDAPPWVRQAIAGAGLSPETALAIATGAGGAEGGWLSQATRDYLTGSLQSFFESVVEAGLQEALSPDFVLLSPLEPDAGAIASNATGQVIFGLITKQGPRAIAGGVVVSTGQALALTYVLDQLQFDELDDHLFPNRWPIVPGDVWVDERGWLRSARQPRQLFEDPQTLQRVYEANVYQDPRLELSFGGRLLNFLENEAGLWDTDPPMRPADLASEAEQALLWGIQVTKTGSVQSDLFPGREFSDVEALIDAAERAGYRNLDAEVARRNAAYQGLQNLIDVGRTHDAGVTLYDALGGYAIAGLPGEVFVTPGAALHAAEMVEELEIVSSSQVYGPFLPGTHPGSSLTTPFLPGQRFSSLEELLRAHDIQVVRGEQLAHWESIEESLEQQRQAGIPNPAVISAPPPETSFPPVRNHGGVCSALDSVWGD